MHITTDEVKKVIHDLKNNKVAAGEIPVKILKNCGCVFDILKNCFNRYQLKLSIFLII